MSWRFRAIALFLVASSLGVPLAAQEPPAVAPPVPVAGCPDPTAVLQGPVLSNGPVPGGLAAAPPAATDRALPINLATALRLSGARPVVIEAAQASEQAAVAELQRARVLWLPSFNVGAGYYRHDGATQGQSGNFYTNSKEQFFAGAGLTARLATADAIFAPLAARQVLRARASDVQAARNDALLNTAEAYFNVQQARGRLAANVDVVEKALALRNAIDIERVSAAKPTNLHRARTLLADFQDAVETSREQWGLASADLTRVLRLDPAGMVVPLEPPNLRVTLISPDQPLDDLMPIGLTNRPELASQQALVQAALTRIRQERLRPLVPSVILEGSPGPAGPGSYLQAGVFASGAQAAGHPTAGREDVSVGLVWELQNLGLGNRAAVRERRAEERERLAELFRVQDVVAAEIARAYRQLRSAAARIAIAERGLEEARLTYDGSLAELGKVVRDGTVDIQVRRAFEVVDAVRSLGRAYDTYFTSIGDFNRAQFSLFRALGYPAGILACERSTGPILPVDVTRPPQMAPVCAPNP
jgi:outer membrane protein TolC